MDQRFPQRLWPATIQPRLQERWRLCAFSGVIGRTVGAALGPTGNSSVASVDAESCNGKRVVVAASAIVGPAANGESIATSGNDLTGDCINASA